MKKGSKKLGKNGIGRKLLSLILVFTMAIAMVRPVSDKDAEAASKTWGGYVYLAVEKVTLGQGCVVEPVRVPVYKKETMTELVQRVLGDKAIFTESEYGAYLTGMDDEGEPDGWTSLDIPNEIADAVENDTNYTLYGRNDDSVLSAGDYTSCSGWMTSLNNVSLSVGMSDYAYESGDNTYSDGDVIRIQFSVYGWGQDTNTAWENPLYDFPDKDRLVRLLGDYTGDKSTPDIEYIAALDVFNKWDATNEEIDNVCSELSELNKQRMIATAAAYADNAIEYIHSSFSDKAPVYGSEWSIMTLARAGYEDKELYTSYYKSIIDKVRELDSDYIASKVGATPKSTDNARVILALSSIGADASDVAGYNLILPLADYDFAVKSGINGAVYSLLALDSANYSIPEVSEGKTQTTREKLIEYILDKRVADGGWNYSTTATASDPDMTSSAICALAPYMSTNNDVNTAVSEAVEVLEGLQRYNGVFASYGTANAESTAQVITALSSCGMISDRCVNDVANLFGGLMVFAKGDGSFSHTIEGTANAMASQQATYSLVAYKRAVDGKNSLYNMTDVTALLYNETEINEYLKPATTEEPTAAPTEEPTATPAATATAEPTAEPTATPAATATPAQTSEPTATPAATATAEPAAEPTATPVVTAPTAKPVSDAIVSKGLKYKINNKNEAICTGFSGKALTKISVPSSIKINKVTYKVTAIAAGAFANSKVKSITLGNNVCVIGNKAFYNCDKLKKITIKCKAIKKAAGNSCKKINKNAVIICRKSVAKYLKKVIKGVKYSVK